MSSWQRAERILVVDGDAELVTLLGDQLARAGYQVLTATDGAAALALAAETDPEVALVSLTLPDQSGLDVCRALTSHPAGPAVFVLATLTDGQAQFAALAAGAEACVPAPFDPRELVARISDYLSGSRRRGPRHPLTGLPTRSSIDAEVLARLEGGQAFRLLLIDLGGLSGYNGVYGLERGDEAIRLLADIVSEAAALTGGGGDLVGHAGEDDFVILTTAAAEPLCHRIIARFEAAVADCYSLEDRQRGYSLGVDRQGRPVRHALLRVSIGVVESERHPGAHPVELWHAAGEVLTYARTLPGSAFHVDRRHGRVRLGGSPLPPPHALREARADTLRRDIDAEAEALIAEELQAGLIELAHLPDLPPAAQAAIDRLQHQFTLLRAPAAAAPATRSHDLAPHALADLLAAALVAAAPAAAAAGVALALVGSPPDVSLVTASGRLAAGLQALLCGLAAFSRRGGQVSVEASCARGHVWLTLNANQPDGDRAELLAALRATATPRARPAVADLARGRGLLATLGVAVELVSSSSHRACLTVALPTSWLTTLDSVNVLTQALDDAYQAGRADLLALEAAALAWESAPTPATDAAAPAALHARLASLGTGLQRLMVTANQVALLADEATIERERMSAASAQAEADYLTTVERLVTAIERRWPARRDHARRVAVLTVALGQRLRLAQPELITLYRAGLLADVGLVTVDAGVLDRLGPLSDADWQAIRTHPEASRCLLDGIPALAEALPSIAAHHERYDGAGYPGGLAGPAIPLGARLLAVADAVVAMCSPRPHRPALTLAALEAELVAGSGRQFDPAIVVAARAVLADGSLARIVGPTLATA